MPPSPSKKLCPTIHHEEIHRRLDVFRYHTMYKRNYAPMLFLSALTLLLSLPRVAKANTAASLETLIGIRGPDFVLLGADTAVGPGVVWTATRVDKIAVLNDHDTAMRRCLVAVAGDAADADFLVGLLQAQATLYAYQSGLGTVKHVHVGETSKITPSSAWNDSHTSHYSVSQMAKLARSQISKQLRSSAQARVCLLVAGMEPCMVDGAGEVVISAPETQRLQSQIRQATPVESRDAQSEQRVAERINNPPPNDKSIPQLYWIDELGTLINLPYCSHGIGSMFMNAVLDEGYHPNLTRQQACRLMQKCFGQLRQRYAVQAPQPPVFKCIDSNGVHVIDSSDFV